MAHIKDRNCTSKDTKDNVNLYILSYCHMYFSRSNVPISDFEHQFHGLRTPNEGINQRYQKNWADVADKICLGHT